MMSLVTSFSLGIGLSMDAFAASVAQGARSRHDRLRQAVRTALYFGLFEAVFPVLGWAAGLALGTLMARVDHWIAFLILLAIGLKMIRDGLHPHAPAARPQSPGRMALLALSTSIDAAAVGVTLVVLDIPITLAAAVIGITTFLMTCAGFLLGGLAGPRLPRYAEALGGLMLIVIGTKILVAHTLLS